MSVVITWLRSLWVLVWGAVRYPTHRAIPADAEMPTGSAALARAASAGLPIATRSRRSWLRALRLRAGDPSLVLRAGAGGPVGAQSWVVRSLITGDVGPTTAAPWLALVAYAEWLQARQGRVA